jgi:hypothetical protein
MMAEAALAGSTRLLAVACLHHLPRPPDRGRVVGDLPALGGRGKEPRAERPRLHEYLDPQRAHLVSKGFFWCPAAQVAHAVAAGASPSN